MGDVLAGNHAVWEFDSDSVLIRFERGIRTPRLWSALGQRRIPYEALAGLSVTAGKRDTVVLRAEPRPGADPLAEVAAGQLRDVCDPYRLVLPGERAARAQSLAEALEARLTDEPAERFLVEVPQPPLQLKAYDARATFEAGAVTFRWSRTGASSTKWKSGDRTYPLADISDVEWHSPEGPGGHLRLVLRDGGGAERGGADRGAVPVPADQDPAAVVFGMGNGAVHESLPFAAAVLAAIRRRTPVAAGPGPGREDTSDRLRHLAELHGAGLLTDAEYTTLRDRFTADA
ncbi:DUF4429 domain-containing protein [Streptomyces sp. NPDC090022]|uniref:DUF4429 domain-containing protein n=1 Tax=Streptomyces sp. NPDC090022 TaxID=3365920 RepID=UPI00382010B0